MTKGNLLTACEGNFRRNFSFVFFDRCPRQNCARVTRDGAIGAKNSIFVTISMEPAPLLKKVSSYGLLPRLWLLLLSETI